MNLNYHHLNKKKLEDGFLSFDLTGKYSFATLTCVGFMHTMNAMYNCCEPLAEKV